MKAEYLSNPELSKGIGRRRRDGNGRPKVGHWWFEAKENNMKETNKLLNEMAIKYSYQEKLIKRLTAIIITMAPMFALLEFYDIMSIIGFIFRASH